MANQWVGKRYGTARLTKEELLVQIAKMVIKGWSSRLIAEAIGGDVTRNGVIGHRNRDGLQTIPGAKRFLEHRSIDLHRGEAKLSKQAAADQAYDESLHKAIEAQAIERRRIEKIAARPVMSGNICASAGCRGPRQPGRDLCAECIRVKADALKTVNR